MKLPKCAWCGEPLKGSGSIMVQPRALPGKPRFGWHAEKHFTCWKADPIADRVLNRDREVIESRIENMSRWIAEIRARGEDRVVAGRKYYKEEREKRC